MSNFTPEVNEWAYSGMQLGAKWLAVVAVIVAVVVILTTRSGADSAERGHHQAGLTAVATVVPFPYPRSPVDARGGRCQRAPQPLGA